MPCCICLYQALDVGNEQPGQDRLLLQQCHSLIIQGASGSGHRFRHRSERKERLILRGGLSTKQASSFSVTWGDEGLTFIQSLLKALCQQVCAWITAGII